MVGAGFIGRVHLEAIRRLGHVRIAALAHPTLDKARQLGEEFSIARVETGYRRILSDTSIDAVHVCTPNHLHFSVTKAAWRMESTYSAKNRWPLPRKTRA